MASAPSSSAAGIQSRNKSLGFMANAMKRKHSFIQFFAMTGILLLSFRSLGQKYRLHDLHEDTCALREEKKNLTDRMANIKRGLLDEAALDSSGLFASRLRKYFKEPEEKGRQGKEEKEIIEGKEENLEPWQLAFSPTVSVLFLACMDMIFQVDHRSFVYCLMGKWLQVDPMTRASLQLSLVCLSHLPAIVVCPALAVIDLLPFANNLLKA
ncbi:hypothetical protein RJ641_032559 [Dillenia turbinata]|uniref:Uncharacterized protein n=1 Tax=Dillenia turbinata TaxID=194707 RepID=A0AAN8VZQ8_9MAGN